MGVTMQNKEYICDIDISFSGNNFIAKNKKEYVAKVKATFLEQFNIIIADEEINNIEEIIE
jgi:hypothetical protein